VAVVTGARVKVGFAVALKLLRVGAVVHGVTRFPQDAADRFAREPDFARWRERLALHGLDLRQLPAVERFAERLAQEVSHLDVVVHNAAQTVQRPAGFFARELAREAAPAPEGTRGLVRSFLALAVPEAVDTTLFPAGTDDGFGQPVDLRERTSWNLRLEEVSTRELVEVQVINVLAPYVLTARWREALLRSPFPDRYVVNVSAVEGQFSRGYRSGRHPHTNMAKAALNMLTLTAAPALAREGIYLTAVDTGWVSDQNPWWVTERTVRGGFRLPLDLADAAARVLDPVLRGISQGDRVFGVFLKDYRPAPW
jgi:NAD(P)-dependent dehydrogenase (short-subunit alcohol dehydrogenase family)